MIVHNKCSYYIEIEEHISNKKQANYKIFANVKKIKAKLNYATNAKRKSNLCKHTTKSI